LKKQNTMQEFEEITDDNKLFAKIERDKKVIRLKSNGDTEIFNSYKIERFLDVLELAKEEGKNSVDFFVNDLSIKMVLYQSKSKNEFIQDQISKKEIEIEELKKKLNSNK
jgi:hypothetical protein